MKYILPLLVLFSITFQTLVAQEKPEKEIPHFTYDKLDELEFKELLQKKIEHSQFLLLGEQHGIKEIGSLAKYLYSLAHPLGYNTYCIETDALAAETIYEIAGKNDPTSHAASLKKDFPFSIPFYENPNDYELFQQVHKGGGEVWGLDQVFMAEWRMYFKELAENGSNAEVRAKALAMQEKAQNGFQEAMEKEQFQSMGMFQFEPADYEALKALSQDAEEQHMIELQARSHAIYMDNIQKRYYQNNYHRSQLMKENFMTNYRNSQTENPKVMFRMGAYHMGRGLTETRVYDIGNMASELAESMGKKSVHIMALGIKGQNTIGNPFSPVSFAPYDNKESLVPEVLSLTENLTKKYLVIDTAPLRNNPRSLSEELQKYIFRYDLMIFINDTHAYDDFEE